MNSNIKVNELPLIRETKKTFEQEMSEYVSLIKQEQLTIDKYGKISASDLIRIKDGASRIAKNHNKSVDVTINNNGILISCEKET